MGKNETYWNGLEQYQAGPMFEQSQKHEFEEELPLGEGLTEESMGFTSNRRDFLKLFGFGLTAAAITACVDKPVNKAIPYVVKPENVTPGVASWYATTCQGCSANCGLLVKSREGRPIKVEGNDLHGMSRGGTCAVGQATVLNLYDSERQKGPRGTKATSVDGAIEELKGKLDGIKAGGGLVYVVSNTTTSPSAKKVVDGFLAGYAGAKHVVYDTNSVSALASAHSSGGSHWVPNFQFGNADVVLSIDADFMGNWISPIQFTKDFSKKRKVTEANPTMSRHIHFESRLSLTGSNADLRIPMKPSQLYGAVSMLYNKIVGGGAEGFDGPGNIVSNVANMLVKAGAGKALVVCGINDIAVQTVVKAINEKLGSYGSTIDTESYSLQAQGNDADLMEFMKNVTSAKAVIFLDEANPVYDTAGGAKLGEDLGKVDVTISFNSKENETSTKCKYVIPQTHYLEAWDDAQPIKGHFAVQQPLVRPIFGSVQWQDALLKWSGATTTYYDYLRSEWETGMYPKAGAALSFHKFWEGVVRDGYIALGAVAAGEEEAHLDAAPANKPAKGAKPADPIAEPTVVEPVVSDASTAITAVAAAYKKGMAGMEIVVYEANYMRSGRYGNNPWLQEMPDPITKVTWDNYVSIPYSYAMAQNIKDGDKLKVTVGSNSVTLPAIVQPGLANDSIAIALGWGRGDMVGRVAKGVGANAAPFISHNGETFLYHAAGASVTPTGENIEMAKTQTYIGYELIAESGQAKLDQIEGRVSDFILKETTLSEYQESRAAGNKRPSPHHMLSLWDIHDKKGHHWAMAIDLNSCNGCGNCIVSCNAENNIAMVGRDEVRRRREMHWMRIDRYFRGAPDAQDGSLQMMNQPMLCQHCDNAPCESVCPVLATTHSDEGLNQQTYNRCIGTRYCANNCPYKVRRFNWFSYYWNDKFKDVNSMQHDKVGRLVLNPDVTVRARGVMEKCSMCVQRIQEKKLLAKTEMRNPVDGEIKTACQQSCPTDAIVFGDLNDKDSEVRKLYNNKRGYHALEDVKTLPKVLYLTKVRNNDFKVEEEHEAHAPAEAAGEHN